MSLKKKACLQPTGHRNISDDDLAPTDYAPAQPSGRLPSWPMSWSPANQIK